MPSYTPEQVDELIIKFEKAADKQIAKAPEDVANLDKELLKPMFTATEVSLMSAAELVRDLCSKAVLGTSAADRDYLDDVFGRGCNCERFCRLRDVLGRVVLSQMSCNDPRWKQVSDKITTIEEILRQRGSFKAPAAKAPEPKGLQYPQLAKSYDVGEQVQLEPSLASGAATSFSIEPALPEGLEFDSETGRITGAAKAASPQKSYTVAASNSGGSTTATISFCVTPPPPTSLRYGFVDVKCTVGDSLQCKPVVEGGACTSFAVEPALPVGISLDSTSGVISGSPSAAVPSTAFRITGSNSRGEVSCELRLEISEPETQLITKIIETTNAKDCLALDPGSDNLNTWMVWMVHRAHLNDETLEQLVFSDLSMPPPNTQPLVAPKLMKALQSNTHLASLKLASSNLFREQSYELAEALKVNRSLKTVDISSNDLDAECIKACASKLSENSNTALQTWYMGHQQSMGENVGASCEHILMQLMKDNMTITKLGVKIMDAACRDNIDRYIIRNVDRARRLAKGDVEEEERVAEEKPTNGLKLAAPPAQPASEVFADDVEFVGIVRSFCVEKGQVPTNEQLQSFAKNQGHAIPFSKVAPVMKAFIQKLLDSAIGLRVSLADAYNAEASGVLREWREHKGSWTFVMRPDEGGLVPYTSKKQPPMKMEGDFLAWIQL